MDNKFNEDDYLLLSGIQHFSFCRRQWALIHVEQAWEENLRTVEGEIFHKRAHGETLYEKRGELLIIRGLPVSSRELGLSGACDVVEFHLDERGIALPGRKGCYLPAPVEYKRGEPKTDLSDMLQLCAQAMCLEEMLVCSIPKGYLYYGETRHRIEIDLDAELRREVVAAVNEMHEIYRRRLTPKVKTGSFCRACSLKNLCLPKLCKTTTVKHYISESMGGKSE